MEELVRRARMEDVAVVVVTHHRPALARADWVLDVGLAVPLDLRLG
jgi:hypothetical protein